ncbi:MAG TPA: transcriptional repressor [Cytophagaceae bacterium]
MNQSLEAILTQHNIKPTSQRLSVLKIFYEHDKVFVLPEITKLLGKGFDRITLYRTLQSFENKGLIHKIPDKDGNPGYAYCKHDSVNHSHSENHVHFKCTDCLSVLCLENVEIPAIKLPEKFKGNKYNFLVEGICQRCNS